MLEGHHLAQRIFSRNNLELPLIELRAAHLKDMHGHRITGIRKGDPAIFQQGHIPRSRSSCTQGIGIARNIIILDFNHPAGRNGFGFAGVRDIRPGLSRIFIERFHVDRQRVDRRLPVCEIIIGRRTQLQSGRKVGPSQHIQLQVIIAKHFIIKGTR